jgi:hypothetical protein
MARRRARRRRIVLTLAIWAIAFIGGWYLATRLFH